MVVAGGGHRQAEQILVQIDRFDDGGENQQEAQVLGRILARIEQIFALVGGQRPVVVLAAAVDAGKGLLVQQADEVVLFGHFAHDFHRQLVLVGGNVHAREDGGKLMLGGRYLVVPRLGEHAEFPQFGVQLLHKGQHAGTDGAEVVVFEFLPLGRAGAEQRAAGVDEVLALIVHIAVDEEVLLLGADRNVDLLGVHAEQLAEAHGFPAQGVHRT